MSNRQYEVTFQRLHTPRHRHSVAPLAAAQGLFANLGLTIAGSLNERLQWDATRY